MVMRTGRVGALRLQKNIGFIFLRHGGETIQCVGTGQILEFMRTLRLETIVRIIGEIVPTDRPVRGATIQNQEIRIQNIQVISEPQDDLPFQLKDADEGLVNSDFASVGLHTRLQNRIFDMRSPLNHQIFRSASHIENVMRRYLLENDFIEIHTPKIIGTATEGGAAVFRLDYFGKPAYLTQSPQLYKQMALMGDLVRVFEVGPVFRAENAATHRHLCQFTGFDLELEIDDFEQLLRFTSQFYQHLFERLESDSHSERIRAYYTAEPIRWDRDGIRKIMYWDAIDMLNERDGGDRLPDLDLGSADERLLGQIVRERFGVDVFILTYFPLAVRPFYTAPAPDIQNRGIRWSRSFDVILRGEEISSGGQRINNPDELTERCRESGMDPDLLADYIRSFRLGAPPHGGFGIGLERLVMLTHGLQNVRRVQMFPRDPEHLVP